MNIHIIFLNYSTKAADNLTPVVTKFSGCFAFGKKPKHLDINDIKLPQKLKKNAPTHYNIEQLTLASPSSTPLDLQYIPLAGNATTSSCLPDAKNLENDMLTSTLKTTTPIPNFDNIYQHLLKQNQTDLQIKRPLSQLSAQPSSSNVNTPHNPFYHHTQPDIINHTMRTLSHPHDDLLNSPESHHSSMAPLTHDDHSNASSIQGTFYGPIRTTLPPVNFM